MLNVATMNYTRKRVLRAVRELSRSGDRITYEQIGACADCSAKTAQRAIGELRRGGKIEVLSKGQRVGYRYKVL